MHLTNPTLYALEIVETLLAEGYFDVDKMMDPITLFGELEKAAIKKVKNTGTTTLSEEEIGKCYESAVLKIVDDSIASLIEKGEIEIHGVDKDGQLMYRSAQKKEESVKLEAKFESYIPNGPNICLN